MDCAEATNDHACCQDTRKGGKQGKAIKVDAKRRGRHAPRIEGWVPIFEHDDGAMMNDLLNPIAWPSALKWGQTDSSTASLSYRIGPAIAHVLVLNDFRNTFDALMLQTTGNPC